MTEPIKEIDVEQMHKQVQLALAQRFMDAMRAADFVMRFVSNNGGDIPEGCSIKMNIFEAEPVIMAPSKPPVVTYDITLTFKNPEEAIKAQPLVDEAWNKLNEMVNGLSKAANRPRQFLTSQENVCHGNDMIITVKLELNMIQAAAQVGAP